MKPSTKIVLLRILHSVKCLMIAVVGPIVVSILFDKYGPWHFHHSKGSGDGPGLYAIYFMMYIGIYILYCFVTLIIIHCIKKRLSIIFTIAMAVASIIPFVSELHDCDISLLNKSYITMVPLYWLVSWAFEKRINKLKNHEQ